MNDKERECNGSRKGKLVPKWQKAICSQYAADRISLEITVLGLHLELFIGRALIREKFVTFTRLHWLKLLKVILEWLHDNSIHPSIHAWHYNPFRALASLISCLHSSLFSALFLHPRVPDICNASFCTALHDNSQCNLCARWMFIVAPGKMKESLNRVDLSDLHCLVSSNPPLRCTKCEGNIYTRNCFFIKTYWFTLQIF